MLAPGTPTPFSVTADSKEVARVISRNCPLGPAARESS